MTRPVQDLTPGLWRHLRIEPDGEGTYRILTAIARCQITRADLRAAGLSPDAQATGLKHLAALAIGEALERWIDGQNERQAKKPRKQAMNPLSE